MVKGLKITKSLNLEIYNLNCSRQWHRVTDRR